MTRFSKMNRLIAGSAVAALFLGASLSPALSYVVYKLEDNYYAIKCEDGTLHSYSGGAGGLSTVAPALCEGHGGVADPGGGSGAGAVDVKPAVKKNVPENPGMQQKKEMDKSSPKLYD